MSARPPILCPLPHQGQAQAVGGCLGVGWGWVRDPLGAGGGGCRVGFLLLT